MKSIIRLISILVICAACKQNTDPKVLKKGTDSLKTEPLYPYPQYIQSQVAYVDTAPLGIEMVVYENGVKKDSGFITREVFKQLAKQFVEPDPNEKKWRQDYEENSFQDLSLNTITFTITTKNENLPLQKADILLNPDNKQVKYVVLKKQETKGELFETTTLMWVHNMNFQVSKSILSKEGKESTQLIKVTWDKPVSQL